MPVQEGGPRSDGGQKQDIGQAIEYAKQNSGALASAVRVIVGFFAALFRKRKA